MSANVPGGSDFGSTPRTSSGSTSDTTRQVKETVRDTAQQAAGAVKEQARATYDQKKNVVLDEVGNLASALRDAGGNLRTRKSDSIAAQVTDRVAERLESVNNRLGGKDLDGIIRDVEDFGRRSPAIFLSAAAALGFLAIRFAKSSARPDAEDQWTSSTQRSDIPSGHTPFVSYAEDV